MKKSIKRILAAILVIIMATSSVTCFAAAQLDESFLSLHKGQYSKYVLLGDSVASGYRDQMSENDALFNEKNNQTTYYRVPGSYADVLANAIIEDGSMTAFAAPGFRTIEIRYMLEDDFDGGDEYLFHPAQLDVVGFAGSEEFRTAYKNAIAHADLITLGVGGNDWGAYLGWVVTDILEKENVADKFISQAQDIIDTGSFDLSMIEKLVEVAHLAGALPELVSVIPEALKYGLGNFYSNWDIMIADIYELNPDVTLMVIGMSDNSLKGKYFDYDGVVGEPVASQDAAATAELMTTIVDFIMDVGNKPMIEGADKFGYTYVDTAGTTYVDSHPDADGHIFIANEIIKALPCPDISSKFEDIAPGHRFYSSAEYCILNGIMSGTDDTTFSPDSFLTEGQLTEAFNAMNGTDASADGTETVTAIGFGFSFIRNSFDKGFAGIIKSFSIMFDILSAKSFNPMAAVTRGEASVYFRQFNEI